MCDKCSKSTSCHTGGRRISDIAARAWRQLHKGAALVALFGSLSCGSSTHPELTRVEPSMVVEGRETTVALTGRNLMDSLRIDLDSRQSAVTDRHWTVHIGDVGIEADNVRLLDSHTLSVVVPATLAVGAHDIAVTTPAGANATLSDGLTVIDAASLRPSNSSESPSDTAPTAPSDTAPDTGPLDIGPLDTASSGVVETWSDDVTTTGASQVNDTADTSSSATGHEHEHLSPELRTLRDVLLHRYSFDQPGAVVLDSIGGANGTFINGTLDGLSSAATLGGGSYVALPTPLIAGRNAVTIEVWLIWDAPNSEIEHSWQRIFDFGSSTSGEGLQGDQDTHFFLSPRSGGSAGALHLDYRGELTGSVTLNAARPLTPGVMAHLAAVVDGAGKRMELFVDGASVAVRRLEFALSRISDQNNWLGRSQVTNDPPFQGRIFEFRIYERALAPHLVRASYVAGPDAAL